MNCSIEGDYSKQNSTQSILSDKSQQQFKSDPLFDLSLQMAECLASSRKAINSHQAYQNQLLKYSKEIQLMSASLREQRMQRGFQRSSREGILAKEGSFLKRFFDPIIVFGKL